MFDLIGDVHGHADELEALLKKLGYSNDGTSYRHPERKAFFTGDLIDGGPKIRETLTIVRSMVDSGAALAVMGNHEFNAICYNIPGENGGFLRARSDKNKRQHAKTLSQFEGCESEYQDYLRWFRTLPLFYDAQDFRVVHACWDSNHIAKITAKINSQGSDKALKDDFFREAADDSSEFYHVIEETLKGKEIDLPAGINIADHNGHARGEIRIKWWLNQTNLTWQDLSFHNYNELPKGLVAEPSTIPLPYSGHDKPVFFGHYWCTGQPRILTENICCLDYSVARGGRLVAYRFNGEKVLNNENFAFADALASN